MQSLEVFRPCRKVGWKVLSEKYLKEEDAESINGKLECFGFQGLPGAQDIVRKSRWTIITVQQSF